MSTQRYLVTFGLTRFTNVIPHHWREVEADSPKDAAFAALVSTKKGAVKRLLTRKSGVWAHVWREGWPMHENGKPLFCHGFLLHGKDKA